MLIMPVNADLLVIVVPIVLIIMFFLMCEKSRDKENSQRARESFSNLVDTTADQIFAEKIERRRRLSQEPKDKSR